MNKVIIFPTDEGNVAICYPVLDCGLTIEQIARKDVPKGKPFLFVNKEQIPTDHTLFDAFEADFSNPHGYGIGFDAWQLEMKGAK
jgi:hypothetical protein